ncbi:alpha-1-antitrypsin-like protein GS55-MS [Ranitomeya variabilis]|uniref:alpha-1-antitrypsin-like protein GS55-MS n=1 Tax=Ranitomeya variabilis TaxID=490064 RepID=UPI00405743CC
MKVLQYLIWFIPMVIALDQRFCNFPREEPKKTEDGEQFKEAQSAIVTANIEFALKLFKLVASKSSRAKGSPIQNIVISPLSFSTMLSTLVLGARSTTHQEIMDVLNQNHTQEAEVHGVLGHLHRTLSQPESNLQINIGNAVFVDKKMEILESFLNETVHYYQAEIVKTDFTDGPQVKGQINDHVKSKTDGKIPEVIKDLDPDTLMVLINFVLFKGEWKLPFVPLLTTNDKFIVDKDTTVNVPMMSNPGVYKIHQDKKLPCTVIELPYKSKASMLLIVPEDGKIHDVEEALSVDMISGWRKSMGKCKINLHIPKFSITSSLDLKTVLSDLGMAMAFSVQANFSGMSQDVQLRVSQAVHTVILNVDARGTEGTPFTGLGLTFFAPSPEVKVNKPFLVLVIDDETNTILFLGRITNPLKKNVEM